MKKYGIVLIGCGHIGQEYMQDIYFREQIQIVGVVDTDPRRAEQFARMYCAQSWNTQYESYLERDDVDIVIIATYVNTHLKILKECLQKKKHVICEKPIGTTLEEGSEFVKLVKASDCKVAVSHILRYNQTYLKAAELIQAGVIGEVKVMRMVQNHHCKDWERYKRLLTDCSPIVDCGVHYIDVMQWFTNSRVIDVDAFGTIIDNDLPGGVYNYGVIHTRLENGAIGYYEAGWSKNLPSSNVKEFIGDKGRLSIVLNAARSQNVEEGDLIQLYLTEHNEYRTINIDSKYKNMWALVQRLIEMIEKDVPSVPTIDDIYRVFQVVMRADQSVREKGLYQK